MTKGLFIVALGLLFILNCGIDNDIPRDTSRSITAKIDAVLPDTAPHLREMLEAQLDSIEVQPDSSFRMGNVSYYPLHFSNPLENLVAIKEAAT